MKLIIEIDDEIYNKIVNINEYSFVTLTMEQLKRLDDAIRNGIPLPKGHGRLIDADALEFEKCTLETESDVSFYMIDKEDVENAPTIIEAEKEGRYDT